MRHSQTTIANGIPIIDLHPSNERRNGGVVRAQDEHLPRFSDEEAPGEEAEAEEARGRRGRQSRKSRGSPPYSTSHAQRCEEELGEAGSNVRRSSGRRGGGDHGEAARPPARHLPCGGMRRSSGWRVAAAMVERRLSGEEPGRSAAASKESGNKTTSGAEEEEACKRERERGGAATMGGGGASSLGAWLIMVARLHTPLETVSLSYIAILRFVVFVGDSLTISCLGRILGCFHLI
jgi:hypothetical protein